MKLQQYMLPSPFKQMAPAYAPLFFIKVEFLTEILFSFVIAPPYPMAVFSSNMQFSAVPVEKK